MTWQQDPPTRTNPVAHQWEPPYQPARPDGLDPAWWQTGRFVAGVWSVTLAVVVAFVAWAVAHGRTDDPITLTDTPVVTATATATVTAAPTTTPVPSPASGHRTVAGVATSRPAARTAAPAAARPPAPAAARTAAAAPVPVPVPVPVVLPVSTVAVTGTLPTTPAPAPPSTYYATCADARAAGATNIPTGAPGYREGLDADHDGIACESTPDVAPAPGPELPSPEPLTESPTATASTTESPAITPTDLEPAP